MENSIILVLLAPKSALFDEAQRPASVRISCIEEIALCRSRLSKGSRRRTSSAHARISSPLLSNLLDKRSKRGSRKIFQRKGDRTEPCGVDLDRSFEAVPPPKIREVILSDRKLAISLI